MLELNKGLQLADRYTLVRRLGGDATTHTWLAKDRLTGASVALKITSGDASSAAALRAEWQASIRMMHAHIVRAFEFHVEPDAAFYSQQFVDGPHLGVLTGLSVDDVLGPIGLLADALAYVHSKGTVHRDIKASNVLLDANGAPYLTDFGAAAPAGQSASGGSLIAQSPQSLDGQPAAASDDIFALGGLVYELLSGRPPWTDSDIAEQIRHADAVRLGAANGEPIPSAVIELVSRMLDKDASRRPSASAVVEQLKASGFEPQTASIKGAARPQVREDVIESVESIRPAAQPDRVAGPSVPQAKGGLGQTKVLLAFAALIAVLVAVVVVLPNRVQNSAEISAEPPQIAIDSELAPDRANAPEGDSNRPGVYVDPEVRKRLTGESSAPTRKLDGDEEITFSENDADYSGLDQQGRSRYNAETVVGELLSAFEVLESRGVERWAAMEYRAARKLYADGDAAYLKKDFAFAEELYLGSLTILEPLYEQIEPTFEKALADATSAFAAGDRLESLRLFELAVAVTPSHADAQAGYQRARNLDTVLRLVEQGLEYEEDLELEAAQRSFEQAVELDELWQPAHDGILRVQKIRTKMEFDTRMTEGFDAILAGDYLAARAAFRVAKQLIPESSEPADGLLQVDQGLRLQDISSLEREALALQQDEHWDAVVETYQEILKVDNTLQFAREGLMHAREMSALHTQLDEMIVEPDKLSAPSVMQKATMLVVSITTRSDVGERLGEQRDELSRLLKRAATPLKVSLVSDNATDVFVYKVGRLGNFMRRELNLRPGTYVAVGSRTGFRDVRLEFRVAPEAESEPVIVQCEERI